MRRRLFLIAAGASALGLAGVAWWAATLSGFRSSLHVSSRAMDQGRYGEARAQLARLAQRWPGQAEVEYRLGVCEQAEGHADAALAAWSRVPADSPQADGASLRRAETVIAEKGRFSEGEAILTPLAAGDGPLADEARRMLARLARHQGRLDEERRLLQQGWEHARDRAGVLRSLWLLDADPIPVDTIKTTLDEAAAKAPDDERVGLGRANLALVSGRLTEAERWLDTCLKKSPDDVPAWTSRLRWGVAAERPDVVRTAASHVPAEGLTPAELLSVRAWFAARVCDRKDERDALEALLTQDAGAAEAMERLAVLAVEAGDAERATTFRRRKAEADRARERYRALLAGRPDPSSFEELGGLAESLGRSFEAKGWWTLTFLRSPSAATPRAALARIEAGRRRAGKSATPGATVADRLADLLARDNAARATNRSRLTAPVDFTDDAGESGLRFVFDSGASAIRQLPETMAGGVGLLDFDGDGRLDVYAVQGGPFPPPSPAARCADRLFRNVGGGHFEDVSVAAGLAAFPGGYGHGVAVGDYDNDGHPDLFVTRWRSYALYRNRGDGTFEDATERTGLSGDRDWPTSAAFADLDNDGDLDLYVCHYLAWDAEHPTLCRRFANSDSFQHCDPRKFTATADHLFRNDGGRFVDVTAEAGILDPDGRGLGVVAADVDDDGLVDLFVANDTTANYLFRNLGGMKFEEIGFSAGVACNAGGGFQAGMGVAAGDLDGDGRIDLFVTNFYGESTSFYRNLTGKAFSDETAAVGLAAPSRFLLGFGISIADVDNDGRPDLATANGHVNDYSPHIPQAMPAQLLLNTAGRRLADVSGRAGAPWGVRRVGRGMAAGDLDNDGRPDFVLLGLNEPLAWLRNRSQGGHFVSFRLEGTASARDAVGARLALEADGRRQVATRFGGGSYLSACDPRIAFGLGAARVVDTVEVRWPSGRVDRYRNLAADTGYLLREGEHAPRPLAGYARPAGPDR